jgi:hypothetical protein
VHAGGIASHRQAGVFVGSMDGRRLYRCHRRCSLASSVWWIRIPFVCRISTPEAFRLRASSCALVKPSRADAASACPASRLWQRCGYLQAPLETTHARTRRDMSVRENVRNTTVVPRSEDASADPVEEGKASPRGRGWRLRSACSTRDKESASMPPVSIRNRKLRSTMHSAAHLSQFDDYAVAERFIQNRRGLHES